MNENVNNDSTSYHACGEHLILDAANEEVQNSDVVVIDSEVTDENELGNGVAILLTKKCKIVAYQW